MREMKDSGVEWIGEIPRNWDIKRIKAVLCERNETNSPVKTNFILSLTNDRGVIPYTEKGDVGNKSKDDLTGYKLAYEGDIVLNSMNVIIGSVALSSYYGCVSPVYYMLYTRNQQDSIKYYNYLFQTKELQNRLKGYGNGIMEIRMRIQMSKLNTVEFPIAPSDIQHRIADYLDRKCSKIDEIIEKEGQVIEKLKAYKLSVITEAVTKGLNPNVPMKDSGVEWIGKVPEHWNIEKFKNYFELSKGLSITKENLTETGIPVVSYGQIHSKINVTVNIKNELIRYVSEDYLESDKKCLAKENDLFFADTSEDLDGCGNLVRVDDTKDLFAGYHTIIASPKNRQDSRYLAYLSLTKEWRSQIRCRVSGIKLFSITQKILKQLTIVCPTIIEQMKIADYLDQKCEQIDETIAKKQSTIEKLTAYKKSLIYEVVTGKKEV